MVFSTGHMAPLPVSEPSCCQTQSQGQMGTLGQEDRILQDQDPSLSLPFQKATVLHLEDGHPHHYPKGSPCTPWLGPIEETHDGSTPQVLSHWGAHNIPIPWVAQISPAEGWDN